MKVSFKGLIDNVLSGFQKNNELTKGSANPLYVLDVMRNLNIDRNIQISEGVMDSNKLMSLVLDEIVKGDMLDQLILDDVLIKGWKTKEEVDDAFRLAKDLVKAGEADPNVLQKAQDNIAELNEIQRLIKDENGNVIMKSFFVNDLNKAFSDQRNAETSLKKGDNILLYWVGNYTNTAYISKGVVAHVGEDWIDASLEEELKTNTDFVYKAEHTIHIPRVHNAAWSEDWRMKLSI